MFLDTVVDTCGILYFFENWGLVDFNVKVPVSYIAWCSVLSFPPPPA